MPDGVVQWCDAEKDRASIVAGGRAYSAEFADIEPMARHAGVHVHFDTRGHPGSERAVDVTVRDRGRGSHRPRRNGAPDGARRSQTDGSAPAARTVELGGRVGSVTVMVATDGRVDEAGIDYAVERVCGALRHIDEPVLFAQLKLSHVEDPARPKPALGQVAVDVNGELVRAHVAAHDMNEAADLLQRRLDDKLEHRAQHRRARRTRIGVPEPGAWRHGDLPAARPDYFDRPVEERELVRHKTFAVDELTPDEAAFDMDQLDYDFYLFRDLASGQDSVLEWLPDGTYRLTYLHPDPVETGPASIALTVAPAPAPELTVHEAMRRMDADGEPFVFFADPTTGRGNVVYRRYDGHYGLITPE